MKTLGHHLKWIAIILSTLLVFQSCRVYHSKSVTVDEAILSKKRVKVKNFDNDTFKFEELQREDGQLYGITKKTSNAAKKLDYQFVDENLSEKYVKILLPEHTIREYHLQNKTMSTLITILIPVTLLIGLLALIWTQAVKQSICFPGFNQGK